MLYIVIVIQRCVVLGISTIFIFNLEFILTGVFNTVMHC